MRLEKSLITVGGLTSVSRLFGLLREMLMSYFLGASVIADAFIVAFKFPNFFRRFFAEGAFNAAFVPEFAGVLASHGKEQAKEVANQVFSWLTLILCIFVILVVIFTPTIIHIIAPGFCDTPERLAYAIEFTRITFPYILFISLAALLSGVLNSLDRFAAAAATPVLLNIFMIAAMLLVVDEPGFALCVGVITAGIVQFIWLYYAAAKQGFKLRLQMPTLNPSVSKILTLMVPGAIGAGVMQINIFIDMMLASTLPTGSLAFLYYADRLNQLPLSVFGIAIGTVLLPSLSKALRLNNQKDAVVLQEKAMSLGLRLSIPSAFGLVLLANPIINLIYGRGSFTYDHVLATAPALAAFAIGLPAYILSKIFTTGFFAKQNTKTPLKIGMITVAVNLILNLLLIGQLLHVGMALATGLAAWVQAGLLAWKLKEKSMISLSPEFYKDLLYVVLASVCMGALVYQLQVSVIFPSSFIKSVVYVFGLVGVGIATFGGVYKACLFTGYYCKKTGA